MASKHKHRPGAGGAPAPLEPRIRRALTEGRTQQALELARQLYKDTPTPPNLELLRQASWERARQLRTQGHPRDAATVLEHTLQLVADDPAWLARLAEELAAVGHVARALEVLARLPEGPARARVLAQAADTAMQAGPTGRNLLPENLRPAFDHLRQAFAHAEAGHDEAARESLQLIGLQSPFLEWKVLLRGLLAYYQKDDARALENWQRLDPARVPARLAAPLRYPIDPAFRAANPPETQAQLQKQADRLQGAPVVPSLRAVQSALANTERVGYAFRLADGVVQALRLQAPHLVPRLAACFYWAVVNHGEAEDALRYQRIFGAPADDPRLDRLRALMYEQMGEMQRAHHHWQHFEQSIETSAAAWPVPGGVEPSVFRNRVRALVWARMGNNAAAIPDVDKLPNLPEFLRDHPARPKPLKPGAEECFRRSLELSPDRLESHTALFQHYQRQDQDEQAADVGRRLLERFPEHVPTLESLGDLYMKQEQYADALPLYQRAFRVSPLERRLRHKVAQAHLYSARPLTESGHFDEARVEYRAALALEEPKDAGYIFCKWAACEFKAGDAARAEELLQESLSRSGSRIDVAFHLLIEATRLKLAAAVKKRFDQDFKTLLEQKPTATDAAAVAATAASHRQAGVKYYGQKTHEKKILAYVEKALKTDFTAEQLTRLCYRLLELDALKVLRKFTAVGHRKFRDNPHFLFLEAESYIALGPDRCPTWKVLPLLEKARQLAAALPPDDRQKALLEDIQRRQQMVDMTGHAFSFLQDFLGGMADDYWDDEDEDDDWEDEPIDFPTGPQGKKRRR